MCINLYDIPKINFSVILGYVAPKCLLNVYERNILRINSEDGPLIYAYENTSDFRYPMVDSGCIYDSIESRIHVACPNHSIYFHSENVTMPSATYLTYNRTGPYYAELSIHGHTDNKLAHFYSVGYQVNVVDFLMTYNIMYMKDRDDAENSTILASATVVSVIEKRPKFDEFPEYRRGLIYQKKSLNFTDIYNKESQLKAFQEQTGDEELVQKYFSGKFSKGFS